MSKSLLRGNFDLVLLALLDDGAKYGLELIAEARSRTDGYFDLKEGSLYPALARLETAKSVESEVVASKIGGPPRRYYRLTQRGRDELLEKRRTWEQFNGKVGSLWEKSNG